MDRRAMDSQQHFPLLGKISCSHVVLRRLSNNHMHGRRLLHNYHLLAQALTTKCCTSLARELISANDKQLTPVPLLGAQQ